MRQLEHLRVIGQLEQEVAFAADVRLEAHHQLLADRIDRGIGDLREVLLEVVEEQLRASSESTASGVSVPIEPRASSPFSAIGAIKKPRSSCV